MRVNRSELEIMSTADICGLIMLISTNGDMMTERNFDPGYMGQVLTNELDKRILKVFNNMVHSHQTADGEIEHL